jgi:thymidylate synthase
VRLQIAREPFPLPSLRINRQPSAIDQYRFEDFEILGYQAHPHIKGDIAV